MPRKRTVIILSSFILFTLACCIMPGLLLYFLGFSEREDLNKDLVQTTCLITHHRIDSNTCSNECNCYNVCSSPNKCIYLCNTCTYTCYSGSIQLRYYDQKNQTQEGWVLIYSGESSKSDMNENYPIGKEITCYYDKNNPNSVRLNLYDTKEYYIFAWIFFGIAIACPVFGLLIWRKCELGLC